MNKQRETIYKKRKNILTKKNLQSDVIDMIKEEIKKFVQFHSEKEINYKEIAEISKSIFLVPDNLEKELEKIKNPEKISERLIELAEQSYKKKEEDIEEKNMRQVEKFVLLRSIDTLWMDHLDNMDHLRDSVSLRAYGQKDPLVEYKNEGIRMFRRLLETIQTTIVNTIYKVSLGPVPPQENVVRAGDKKSVGRNDPCPCGSGKKYKKCCYPKYGR